MDFDLAQVRAFVVVADHHHFGHAAERLNLSQQAVSRRIQRLEERLAPSCWYAGRAELASLPMVPASCPTHGRCSRRPMQRGLP